MDTRLEVMEDIMRRLLLAIAFLFLVTSARAAEPTLAVNSTAYEASHVLKTTSGVLYNLTVNYHTAAYRTLMVFDGTAAPVNGATTSCPATHTTGCLLWCFEGDAQSTAPAQSFSAKSFVSAPVTFTFGAVVIASVSTNGCTTLTADGNNEWYNAQIDAR